MKRINFGLLGTAGIAGRSVIEPAEKSDAVTVYAVASRSLEKAAAFAHTYSIPCFFEGYDALLQCREVDAIYIPLINSLHAEYTIKAIEAGKHVLVEKPMCLNARDADRIAACCKDHPQIVVLEGLMSQHHPFNGGLKAMVDGREYGALQSISTRACYTIDKPDDFRLFPEKGGSVFFDEGLLWCHLTQLCIGLHPVAFDAHCDFNGPHGGDHTFQASLTFPNGVTSAVFCSLAHPYQADHVLEFEKAVVTVKNFWRPTFGKQKLTVEIAQPNAPEAVRRVFEPQNYFSNQLAFFSDVIQGKTDNVPITDSLERIKIMEKIFHSAKGKSTRHESQDHTVGSPSA